MQRVCGEEMDIVGRVNSECLAGGWERGSVGVCRLWRTGGLGVGGTACRDPAEGMMRASVGGATVFAALGREAGW